jgi:hypothetical protein
VRGEEGVRSQERGVRDERVSNLKSEMRRLVLRLG